jgi:hypothetical protein
VSGPITQAGIIVVSELSGLLGASNNEELIACALTELLVCLLSSVFGKIKDECPIGQPQQMQQGGVPRESLVILQGAYTLVRMNLNNRAL